MSNGDDLGFVPTKQADDDLGFIPAKKVPKVSAATMGPDERGVLQRLGDWYMRAPAYEGTLAAPGRSPREKVQAGMQGAAVASLPLIGGGLMMAPAATLFGLGGAALGGLGGGYLGGKIGEEVGAPELGEDVGGLAGSIFGGYAGARGVPYLRSTIGGSKMFASVPQRTLGDVMESPSKAPAYAFRKMFPEPAERVAMRQPLQASLEERMMGVEKARQQELADAERLREQQAQSLMKRGIEQERIDVKAAKQAQALEPRVVSPQTGSPFSGPRMSGSEGRAATWTNEQVMRLAQQGNREAIQQVIRRGMMLPSGARYVMGDPDFARAVYNPREVTMFTPEGKPIRNVENPTERAPRERIVTSEREPAAKEIISAETGEVTQRKPKYPIGAETRFKPKKEK
jgi:hypothetical protein